MIFINKDIEEALVMVGFIKIFKKGIFKIEEIIENVCCDDLIKVLNELVLSSYKHKDIIASKIRTATVRSKTNKFINKVEYLNYKIYLNSIKDDFNYILITIDVLNNTIKEIYKFVYYYGSEVLHYTEDIKNTLDELEYYIVSLKLLLNKYL